MTHGRAGAGSAADDLRELAALQPHRHRFHLGVAVAFVACLPVATAPKDVLGILLFIAMLLRGPRLARLAWRHLRTDAMLGAAVLFSAVSFGSLLWTSNVELGFDFAKTQRFLLAPFALWPLLPFAGTLIGALLVGIAGLGLLQLAQLLELFGLRPGMNGRLGGLLHPIHAGTYAATAMCLYGAILLASRRWLVLVLAAAGFAAAAAGLLASGSRGPWIAATVAMPTVALISWVRRPDRRRRIAGLTAVAIVAGVAAWPLAGDMVGRRVEQARADIALAADGDFDSETGFRLISWRTAIDVAADRPWAGVGIGGYRARAAATEHAAIMAHASHPHSTPLQIAAELGVAGLVPFLALLGIAVWRGTRLSLGHPAALGIPAALVGWFVASQFESSHVAGQVMALLGVLLILTHPAAGSLEPEVQAEPDPDARAA